MSSLNRIIVTIITQGTLIGISFITGIILPKYMDPESYGYWQIYYFYLAYINIFGLGFNDGLILNYAGSEYLQLPMVKLRSSIRIMIFYALTLTLIFSLIAFLGGDGPRQIIYIMLSINILPIILFYILTSIFLATNQSGIYNFANLSNRFISNLCFLVLIFMNSADFQTMIWADTAARVLVTGALCIVGVRLFFGTSCNFNEGLNEIKTSCSSGIKIMLAVVALGMIPILGRIVIEWNEPIEVYGIYSFAISLNAIILSFTNAVGLVVFPMIKRLSNKQLTEYYKIFNLILGYLGYIAFLVYIPITLLIKYYMPNYLSALDYIPVLIVMCLPLGKIQLLVFPYYKTLCLENQFLKATLFGFILMVVATMASYNVFNSVISVAVASTIVLTLWYIGMSQYLSNKLGDHKKTEYILELAMMTIFVLSAYRWDNLLSFGTFYTLIILFVMILNHKLTWSSKKSANPKVSLNKVIKACGGWKKG